MAACAGATGIPLSVLRAAKRAGCKAFDQAGRVHLGPLLRWLFNDTANDEAGTDWHQRFKRAQAIGLEVRTAKERGDLVDRAVFVAAIQRIGGGLKTLINNVISTEPMKLAAAGGDVPACRHVLRSVLDDFWNAFRELGMPHMKAAEAHTNAATAAIINPVKTKKTTNEKRKKKTK